MKKGIGYTILLNLVITIFIGGLVNVNPVNAYTPLSIGDQLLYTADFSHNNDYFSSIFYHSDMTPMYISNQHISHYEFDAVEKHSYNIGNSYASDYDLRHTSTYQDTYRNEYWDDYTYNYMTTSWDWNGGDTNNQLYSGSNTNYEMLGYNSSTYVLDISYFFHMTTYDHTTSKSYTINGVSTMYTVDVYIYAAGGAGMNPYPYYDIQYDEFWDDLFEYTYYVDPSTGFILEIEIDENFHYSAFIDDVYSASVGSNITYIYDDFTNNNYHYYLTQTTAAYGSATDADLPGIEWDYGYIYELTGDTNYVDVYFWLFDASPVDLDIYKEGTYLETLYGFTAGHNSYRVYYDDIPPSFASLEFKIVATDVFDLSHQTEWKMWISDYRLDWPQISGPAGDVWYDLGTAKTYYWTLTDSNMDPHFYEFKFNGTIVEEGLWFDGKLLALNAQVNITTPGDYEVSIFANDTMGHESYKILTIHAGIADRIPPTVTSPADVYMKPGESKEINWVIADDNPSHFKVTRNGTVLIDQPWGINNFNVNVSLDTLSLGTWVFLIEVWDQNGNYNFDRVYVYVTEAGTNPTGPSNTVTLDSPGILYLLIGFLSITAITVYVRKRK